MRRSVGRSNRQPEESESADPMRRQWRCLHSYHVPPVAQSYRLFVTGIHLSFVIIFMLDSSMSTQVNSSCHATVQLQGVVGGKHNTSDGKLMGWLALALHLHVHHLGQLDFTLIKHIDAATGHLRTPTTVQADNNLRNLIRCSFMSYKLFYRPYTG